MAGLNSCKAGNQRLNRLPNLLMNLSTRPIGIDDFWVPVSRTGGTEEQTSILKFTFSIADLVANLLPQEQSNVNSRGSSSEYLVSFDFLSKSGHRGCTYASDKLGILAIFCCFVKRIFDKMYGGLTKTSTDVASPCRTICTVCGFVALS